MKTFNTLVAVSCAALMASTASVRAASMDDLVKAAKAEGELTVIAEEIPGVTP